MSSFKDKTQGFFMGLMVGLIVAGSFFILKLDDYFKELNFYKSFIHTFSSETKPPVITDNKEEQTTKENKIVGNKNNNKSISTNDSTKTKNINQDLVEDTDTLNTSSSNDTLIGNTALTDDVVVKKDELLTSKTFEVINLNPTASPANAKDSLLQKVSGVQEAPITDKQVLNVEFWQSPLNYRGYKLSRYKMVLYGIPSEEEIKFYKMDDNIYLKSVATVYKLDYVSDFKSYERITDENIINKLK